MHRYPNPCARCGLCCLTEPCPTARRVFHVAAGRGPCPFLEIDPEGLATCDGFRRIAEVTSPETAAWVLGIGAGCCLAARLRDSRTGTETPFAGLTPAAKRAAVQVVLERGAVIAHADRAATG